MPITTPEELDEHRAWAMWQHKLAPQFAICCELARTIRAADEALGLSPDTLLALIRGEAVVMQGQSMETAPRDGTPICVRVTKILRWLPYKGSSQQRKRGIEGRWQELNEHGGWDNCAPPQTEWMPHPQSPKQGDTP